MREETDAIAKASPRLQARIAGFLYLLIILAAVFVPFHPGPSGFTGMTFDAANASILAEIQAAGPVYVLGGVGFLAVLICDVGVALIFYHLLKPVDRGLALLAAFFRLVYVAIAGAGVVNHFAPLAILSGADYLRSFEPDQLQALALMSLKLHIISFDISLVFFGVHCALVGYLFFRSTFFPRIIGLLLAIGGGSAYLANIFVHALSPAIRDSLFPYAMFGGTSEILLTAWLLIIGLNAPKWKAQAGAAWAGPA
jgi:hypothetical protein